MNSTILSPIFSPVFPIVTTTQLLISVTSVEEAQIALENGADIIDLKDPSAGALGALPIEQIKLIVAFVNAKTGASKKLTSATIGDLPMQPELLLERVAKLATTEVDVIKIGFFETDNYQLCLDALQGVTQAGTKLMAVLFAESTYPESLIEAIKNAGFIGVMLDTAKKNGLTLMDYYSEEQRKAFAQKVFKNHLQFGLAGSLKLQHIAKLREINPTYMGFRGGVCDDNQRELSLDAEKIKAIRKTL
jgi:uncharacterized protein (UPF0264 family)